MRLLNFLIFFALIVTGCSKYDDGGISFFAKKNLTTSKWRYANVADSLNIFIKFYDDKTFVSVKGEDTIKGEWDFEETRKVLKCTFDYSLLSDTAFSTRRLDVWDDDYTPSTQTWSEPSFLLFNEITISKLTKDQLWFASTVALPEIIDDCNSEVEIMNKLEAFE